MFVTIHMCVCERERERGSWQVRIMNCEPMYTLQACRCPCSWPGFPLPLCRDR